jgi:hypothetical protein
MKLNCAAELKIMEEIVGPVENTALPPDPVFVVRAENRFALDGVARNVATPAAGTVVANAPKVDPLVLVQVMTPVPTTIVQSPDMVNPAKAVPALLYWIWFAVPPGFPAPPVHATFSAPPDTVAVHPEVKFHRMKPLRVNTVLPLFWT